MSILHIVNRQAALAACLTLRAAGEPLVLIEDAVYCALKEVSGPCYVQKRDLIARGLEQRVHASIRIMDDAELVGLTIDHTPAVTWTC
jgi:sulfur relay protein TusB/DsrH